MSWIELGRVAPERLERSRLALHWAAQLPSAVGGTLLTPRSDGAHACLGWLASHRALAGPLIPGTVAFRAALRVPDLCLLVLDAEGAELAQRPVVGCTMAQGLFVLASAIELYTGRVTSLARVDAELPDFEVARGRPFPEIPTAELLELAAWFANADSLLRPLTAEVEEAGVIRCSPEALDLTCTIALDGDDAITVGMSVGDDQAEGPYFFVAPWPEPEGSGLPSLPHGGRWQADDWFGASLSAAAIARADDQQAAVARFLDAALEACYELLDA